MQEHVKSGRWNARTVLVPPPVGSQINVLKSPAMWRFVQCNQHKRGQDGINVDGPLRTAALARHPDGGKQKSLLHHYGLDHMMRSPVILSGRRGVLLPCSDNQVSRSPQLTFLALEPSWPPLLAVDESLLESEVPR
ncbi:hypothetical protein GWK47_005166 [Chionoecetes opilio]|uniref:Uncharacterized protein n=1 Tax=Chionoecetes opilio TaxID=41210 RepID=A0A8J4YJL7_CHIOP|nr:hypothetical protein GWK47_005166 [Chionoecetes opilio]